MKPTTVVVTVLGVVVDAITILIVVNSDTFDTPVKKSLAAASVTFLILAVSLTIILLSRHAFTGVHGLHTLLLLTLAGSVTALLLAFRPAWIDSGPGQTPPERSSYPAPNTAFKITSPTARVPLCTPVSGPGNIPSDKDLWILIEDDDGDYWPIAVAHAGSSPNEWTTRPIEIGTPNTQEGAGRHLHAMLLDKETSALIGKVVEFANFNWHDSAPPPHAVPVADRVVTRRADERQCGQTTS